MRRPTAKSSGTVAGYLRVSTGGQDARTQRADIVRAAAARGDRIGRWFEEKRSGRSMVRPALSALRGAVHSGEVRRLYVFRLDRLTRRGVADMFGIVHQLRAAGCELVSARDPYDLEGPVGDVVLAVLAMAAQVELDANAERLAAARARVEAAGGKWGRPFRLEPAELAKIRQLSRAGKSIREIAQHVGVPRSTVHEALSRA